MQDPDPGPWPAECLSCPWTGTTYDDCPDCGCLVGSPRGLLHKPSLRSRPMHKTHHEWADKDGEAVCRHCHETFASIRSDTTRSTWDGCPAKR